MSSAPFSSAATVFAVLAVLVAGCGDDDTEAPSTPRWTAPEESAPPPVPPAPPFLAACARATAPPNTLGQRFNVSMIGGTGAFPGPCELGRQGATVYRLDVTEPSVLVVDTGVVGAADAILHVGRGECGARQEELICDGFGNDYGLRFTQLVEPDVYFISVAPNPAAAAGGDGEDYAPLRVRLEASADLEALCEAAPALVDEAVLEGSTAGAKDRYPIPSYPYMNGVERLFRLELESTTRVTVEVDGERDGALSWVDACPLDTLVSPKTHYYDSSVEEDGPADRRAAERRPQRLRYTEDLSLGTHFLVLDMAPDVEFTLRTRFEPSG